MSGKILSEKNKKIAIIGSGIAGLTCAYKLSADHDVTLYEANTRAGGHSNTVVVEDPKEGRIGVDTGFIVHNDRNYTNLLTIFKELNVPTQASEMSFSVNDREKGISYRATSPRTLFANKQNLYKKDMWKMLKDIWKFHRDGHSFLAKPQPDLELTSNEFVKKNGYSQPFTDLYLTPLGSSVWSASPETFLAFPAYSLLSFLKNHGLLSIGNRPNWKTVTGGSQTYVNKILENYKKCGGKLLLDSPVTTIKRNYETTNFPHTVYTKKTAEKFDLVILACHSDQALQILDAPTQLEQTNLQAIRYQTNTATLHTDVSTLPRNPTTWAAWNYITDPQLQNDRAILTYDLTTLQKLDGLYRYLVTLNMSDKIDDQKIIAEFTYQHPIFDLAAIQAQKNFDSVCNNAELTKTYFCGAYWGYGFHEDGVTSALAVCEHLETNSSNAR